MRWIPDLFVGGKTARPKFNVELPEDATAHEMHGGTAVLQDSNGRWWVHHIEPRRRFLGSEPDEFIEVNTDPQGRRWGWRPLLPNETDLNAAISDSYWRRVSAWSDRPNADERIEEWCEARTEQAVGREFSGSHHGWAGRSLARHHGRPWHYTEPTGPSAPEVYDAAKSTLARNSSAKGLVWWHEDIPIAQVFRTQLGLAWRPTDYWKRAS